MSKQRKSNTNAWYMTDPDMKLPITTTKEMQEQSKIPVRTEPVRKRQVVLHTYPLRHFRMVKLGKSNSTPLTTYQRYFTETIDVCPPKKSAHDVETLDPLMNRIPVNQFEMVPWSPNKFMDDHMFNLSQNRLKINFFRQIRDKAFEFGE